MSNQEMIDNIEKICGRDSISFYNMQMYANADNFLLETVYKQILEREKWNVESRLDDLREKLKLIEKLSI